MAGRKSKAKHRAIDNNFGLRHTETMLQLSGNSSQTEIALGSLGDLRKGDAAVLDRIDLPGDDARRLKVRLEKTQPHGVPRKPRNA